jgi:hypothetical protein
VAAKQGHPLRADGGQDGAGVVHLVLEQGRGPAAVGEAAAHPVEQDQPGERRQLAEEGRERPVLPHEAQVGGPAEEEHQIQVAVADHLIGHAAPVGAVGVPERRAVAHALQSRP